MALTHGDSCLLQIQKDCLSYKRMPQVLFCNQVVQRLLQICSKNWDGNMYRNDFFITKPSEPTKQSIILRLHISSLLKPMSLPWVILKQIFQRFYLRTLGYNNLKVAARLKIWKCHAFSFFFFFFVPERNIFQLDCWIWLLHAMSRLGPEYFPYRMQMVERAVWILVSGPSLVSTLSVGIAFYCNLLIWCMLWPSMHLNCNTRHHTMILKLRCSFIVIDSWYFQCLVMTIVIFGSIVNTIVNTRSIAYIHKNFLKVVVRVIIIAQWNQSR